MTRRIVQITAYSTGTDVLCDDGSLWNIEGASWSRKPDIPQDAPADPDPIAELEAMGGKVLCCLRVDDGRWEMRWFADAITGTEPIGEVGRLSDIRAAAARLLARVKGGAK